MRWRAGKVLGLASRALRTSGRVVSSVEPLARLLEFAQDIRLDTAALKSCVNSGRMQPLINADKNYGRSLQVQSTPTVFINEQRLVGPSEADLAVLSSGSWRVCNVLPNGLQACQLLPAARPHGVAGGWESCPGGRGVCPRWLQ